MLLKTILEMKFLNCTWQNISGIGFLRKGLVEIVEGNKVINPAINCDDGEKDGRKSFLSQCTRLFSGRIYHSGL